MVAAKSTTAALIPATITTETAGVYARLSREDVDGKHAGCDSIKVQKGDAGDAIRSQGWAFNPDRHTFEDDDVSGTKIKRKGWDALLASAARREFSILVVRDLDRIARYEPARAMATLIQLADLGVRVWSYKEKAFVVLEGLGSILTYVKAIAAQQYVESIRANVVAALDRRAAEGRATCRPSLGYCIVDEGEGRGKRWAIDPAGAALVHRVGAALIATGSYYGAARALNDAGLRTSMGRAWRPTTVQQLIERPIYRGRYERGHRSPRGADALQIIEHPELRIWTADEEAAIDAILARPAQPWRASKAHHLSTRLVRCGCCGGRLTSNSSARSKGPDLSCVLRRSKGCPGIGRKKEHAVDAAVISAVRAFVSPDAWTRTRVILADALDTEREADTREAEIQRMRGEVSSAQRRTANLTNAVAEAEDAGARAVLLASLADERKRLDQTRAALARAEAAPAPASPAAVLAEAEREVTALRAALDRGGADATEAIEAILGPEEKFIATREGNTWRLTARGSLARVLGGPSGGMFALSSATPQHAGTLAPWRACVSLAGSVRFC